MNYTTYELSIICGVTERAISKWAGNNGVAKRGRYWEYTEEDYARIFEHYHVEHPSIEPNSKRTKRTEEHSSEYRELKERINILEEQVSRKDEQITSLLEQLRVSQEQVSALIETNKALSTSHVAQTIAENKELLLSDGSKKWWQFWK